MTRLYQSDQKLACRNYFIDYMKPPKIFTYEQKFRGRCPVLIEDGFVKYNKQVQKFYCLLYSAQQFYL